MAQLKEGSQTFWPFFEIECQRTSNADEIRMLVTFDSEWEIGFHRIIKIDIC